VKQLHNELTAESGVVADAGVALERLFELAALLGDVMDAGLAEGGMTRARAEVIWHLHHHGPATQRELSQALRCTPRNVTGLLDALEAADFVARGHHPTDRRATLVTLTEHGVATANAWSSGYRTAAGELFGDVSPADLATFVATMDHVLRRLRQRAYRATT
jgi:DNA-binding MarR family transcriptional regulator